MSHNLYIGKGKIYSIQTYLQPRGFHHESPSVSFYKGVITYDHRRVEYEVV